MEPSCFDLAMEGQQACKLGDYRAGVSFFESAIQVGTEDLQLLSAIYSQMGNAYFQLKEYAKALEYYGYDFTLTSTIRDEAGEAKACGNLGNTLKVVGRCDEAVYFCQRQLDITRATYDKVGQAQALYIFGNVYHAKAMEMSWSGAEPGCYSPEATAALRKAVQYYEANLCLVKERGDRAAEGRAYGKLGHTYHLLGDFKTAVAAHEKRLLIAEEFEDKSAERRAHCNLGSTHIYLGQYDAAVYHYKKTLQLTRLLKERAMEAQVCYSLGNTYTLLQDFERAVSYYLKHLVIAQELNDRVGEGRVYWTLGNIHTALGNHEQAINFTEKHLEIAIETGDTNGAATARMNLSDLRQVVELKSNSKTHHNVTRNTNTNSSVQSEAKPAAPTPSPPSTDDQEKTRSLERKQNRDCPSHPDLEKDVLSGSSKNNPVKTLFLFQQLRSKKRNCSKSPVRGRHDDGSPVGGRHDDGSPVGGRHDDGSPVGGRHDDGPPVGGLHDDRSPAQDQTDNTTGSVDPEPEELASPKSGSQDAVGEDSFLDLLSRFQGHRMDDQRCTLDGQSHFLAQPSPSSTPPVAERKTVSGLDTPLQDPGHFLELLASSQARRLNDQRVSLSHFPGLRLSTSNLPRTPSTSSTDRAPTQASSAEAPQTPSRHGRREASTGLSEEDNVFFDMIEKCQGSRWDDQRCAPPHSSTMSPTLPDEDFFKLLLSSQSHRMEEQRVPPPPDVAQSKPDKHGL